MKHRRLDTEWLNENQAMAKVRMWQKRAAEARQSGRKADAERCDDKVRDWASRARQIQRIQQR